MSSQVPVQPALLNLNENPRMVSARVQEAIVQSIPFLNRYPLNWDPLEAKVAAYLGHGFTAAHIMMGHGGSEVLNDIARSCIGPGDEAIIPIPAFPVYEAVVRRYGGVPVFAKLADDFGLDVEEILARVSPRTKVVYVTSPHNPMGTICTQSQLDILMQELPPDVLLVFDEVYWHFAAHPDRARAWPYVSERGNILILHSFSKAFGLAGLRLGYGIAHPDTITRLGAGQTMFRFNHLIQAAGTAALQDMESVQQSIDLMQGQRRSMHISLAQMEGVAQVVPSEASFVSFRPVPSSEWVVAQLEAHRILVRELIHFRMPGWIRASVGLPSDNQRFLEALAQVLDSRPE